jgi:folate-binding protein YgfZ
MPVPDCAGARARICAGGCRSIAALQGSRFADATADYNRRAPYGADLAVRLGLSDEPGAAKPWESGVVYIDARLPQLGARAILPRAHAGEILARAGLVPGNAADYDRLRLLLGVPDGSRDLPVEKAILLENGFDELHGIDWQKGCYMGQELTHGDEIPRPLRKRLLPVEIEGPLPAAGTPVMAGDKEAGENAQRRRRPGPRAAAGASRRRPALRRQPPQTAQTRLGQSVERPERRRAQPS